MEILILSIIILAVLVLYISQVIPIEITSILILPALVFAGILDLEQAFSGFSSSATITIGAMFILSQGLMRTGVLEFITLTLSRHAKGSPVRVLILLAVVIPVASAFMNNTPVVVMMVPVMLSVASELDVKASKLLIPLSYFAILGGTCTLIGTSTNILVNDLYRQSMPEQGGFN
ncbi:anion permease, partial [bacterium]|nr:anion permease [bacterium]